MLVVAVASPNALILLNHVPFYEIGSCLACAHSLVVKKISGMKLFSMFWKLLASFWNGI